MLHVANNHTAFKYTTLLKIASIQRHQSNESWSFIVNSRDLGIYLCCYCRGRCSPRKIRSFIDLPWRSTNVDRAPVHYPSSHPCIELPNLFQLTTIQRSSNLSSSSRTQNFFLKQGYYFPLGLGLAMSKICSSLQSQGCLNKAYQS